MKVLSLLQNVLPVYIHNPIFRLKKIIIKKKNTGWNLVILFSILPLIIWGITPKIDPVLTNIATLSASIGELFGLGGIVMFSLNLILATRLHFIEKLFNGLNNIYQKHNLLGQTAFILLLFHPLLLIPRYSSTLKEAASFLWISNSLGRNLGIFALAIMLLLIILTLYLRPKYNIWKITHKFFGLALFLGALHTYLIPAYIMENPILKLYVLGFAILGILAFVYKSLLSSFFIKKLEYVVQNIKKLDDKTIEISLKAKNKKLNFIPGQFIFISFFQNKLSKEEHPFSISSSKYEDELKITTKILGDYTQKLFNTLKPGATAKIEGPFGSFSYENTGNKNQIWIAGGIGITPFISFIKSINPELGYNIKLFYCVRREDEAIYLNLLKKYEQSFNNRFKVYPFYSEEKGHISADYIHKVIPNLNEYDFYLCAPPRMINKLREDLKLGGIKNKYIHSEEFNF